MNHGTLRAVRIAAWAAILIIGAAVVWTFAVPHGDGPGELVVANIGGPFALIDQNGTRVTEAALQGHPSALFLGYTFCPDICPTTLADLSVRLQELGSGGDRLKVYFVTIDPARDTAEVLGSYLRAFDPRIVGLTGGQAAIDQIVKAYRVYAQKVPGEGGAYTFDHTAGVYLLDERAAVTGTITYDEDAKTALAKLQRLIGRSS